MTCRAVPGQCAAGKWSLAGLWESLSEAAGPLVLTTVPADGIWAIYFSGRQSMSSRGHSSNSREDKPVKRGS